MSDNPTPAQTPVVSPANVLGSPASSILGAVVAVEPILNSVATNTPTNWQGWLQVAMGILAIFARG